MKLPNLVRATCVSHVANSCSCFVILNENFFDFFAHVRHVLEPSRGHDEGQERAPCSPENHEEEQHVVSSAALPASNSVGLLNTASATVPPPPSLVPPRVLDCPF